MTLAKLGKKRLKLILRLRLKLKLKLINKISQKITN